MKTVHSNTKIVIGTEEREVNTGIPQGSVISPFLFNIFIDDLLRELEKVNADFWAYADDIAFGFRNSNEFHIKMLIIEKWSIKNGMKINVNKCELMILNNAKDLKTEYKRVEVIKYLGIRIKKNLTLNEHFNVCKKKMEMVIFKVANLAAGCNCPSRMVQLFFVILKSVIDYGSILYTKIKAKTTTEKFARLIRVNFKRALRLKMSTPDKIVYEIIGDPIQEWNRRAKQVDKSKEELEVDMEWKKMQEDRIERRDLRKLMYWEAIYIVSIPIGITRICRKCKGEFKFEHIKRHLEEDKKGMIDGIQEIIREQGSLRKIINMDKKNEIKKIWEVYSKLFVNKKSNTSMEDFLNKEKTGEQNELDK